MAIVGTRNPSLYSTYLTEMISIYAIRNGYTIVSGLARGVDTIAHRTAVENGGRTIAVLGSGLDNIYPRENIGLVEKIKNNGAVISQFAPHLNPDRKNFPIRNKTVALMCEKLILVEAKERSGTLITARLAYEAGKEIFIVPSGFAGNMEFFTKYGASERVNLLHSIDRVLTN